MAQLYNVSTRKPEELDGEDLQNALLKGTHAYQSEDFVKVYNPNGELYEVPAQNVKAAMGQGYTVQTPSQKAIDEYVQDNKGAKGAAKVFLGQLADEAGMGIPELIYDKTANPLDVAKKEALKKEHDLANTLGGVTGFGASLFTGAPLFNLATKAGEKAAAKTAEVLAERIIAKSGEEVSKKAAMSVARDLVTGVASKAAQGATEGLIISAPHAITETMLGDPETAAESLMSGGIIGGAFGVTGAAAKELFKLGKDVGEYALTGGKRAIEGGEDAAKTAARKIAKTLTGVNEDEILRYAQNADRIDGRANDLLNKVGGDPDQMFLPIKDDIDMSVSKLLENKTVAEQKALQVRGDMEQAYNVAKQELQNTRAPESLSLDLQAAQQDIKKRLGDYKLETLDAIEKANVQLPRADLEKLIQKQIDNLKVSGTDTIIGQTAKKEQARLEGFLTEVKTLPETLDGKQARGVISNIDPDINWNYGSGEFNELADKNLKQFRKEINQVLRKDKDIAGLLDRSSVLADTLDRFNEKFGTVEKAASNLKSILSPDKKRNLELLNEFGALTGRNFSTELEGYQQAKKALERIKTGEDLRAELIPNLHQAYKQAENDAELAAKDFEPVKRLSQERTQNIIRQQGFKNASIEDRRALEHLSEKNNQNYSEIIDDLNTWKAFQKESTQGSRKTLLGAAIGGAVGGAPGAAVGSAIGAGLDVYGGQLLKKIISGGPNVSGLLYVEKQMKRAAEKLDKIPEIIEGMSKKSPVKARPASIDAMLRLLDGREPFSINYGYRKSNDTRIKSLEKLNEKASQLVSNPSNTGSLLSELSRGISDGGAPIVAQQFNQKMLEGINYLQSQMPKPPRPNTPFAKNVNWQPSDSDLSRFEQKVSVVLDPFVVLDELAQNTLSKQHVDTLKAVYPKIYDQMKMKIMDTAVNSPKPIPYNQRTKLSLLFDTPLDSSQTPKAISDFQKAFMMQDPTIDPKNKKQINIAKEAASDVQRLMG